MLAIGDFISNSLDECFSINNREYILYEKQIPLIKEILNIKDASITFESKFSKSYIINDKKFTFHIADNYIPLEMVLLKSLSNYDKINIGSLPLQYSICKSKIKYIHKDVDEWVKTIETYHLIKDMFVNNENILNTFVNGKFNYTAWVSNTENIINKFHIPREFDIFSKAELYNLICIGIRSLYLRCLLSENNNIEFVSEIYFKNFSENEKLNCVLEKLYVETINQYIIPELLIYDRLPNNIRSCFLKSFMNLVSNYGNIVFITFAIENYNLIVEKYDENIISIIFYNHMIKNGKKNFSNR